jgi:hypothetical protein
MDTVSGIQFVFAFVLVIALIGLTGALMKRYGDPTRWLNAKNKTETTRLRVLETRMLDMRRKLLLVACDNREYILLLADGREQIIDVIRQADAAANQKEANHA